MHTLQFQTTTQSSQVQNLSRIPRKSPYLFQTVSTDISCHPGSRESGATKSYSTSSTWLSSLPLLRMLSGNSCKCSYRIVPVLQELRFKSSPSITSATLCQQKQVQRMPDFKRKSCHIKQDEPEGHTGRGACWIGCITIFCVI